MNLNRSKSSLSKSLDERLNLYALAASAAGVSFLALATPAEARIVFTPAHITLTPGHKLRLDLNHDGIKDFELVDTPAGSSEFLEINPLQTGNAAVEATGDCNPSPGAAVLKAGVLIGRGQVFGDYYCMAQYIGADGGSVGPWAGGVKNRFLGLQFMIKGEKHFAWARLSVSRPPFVVLLSGYAYETVPGKPIIAGKTKGSEYESSPSTEKRPVTLGALAIGAPRRSIWRREESHELH